eukprot:TRINITY_DN1729_c0_g1_i3.p1 TRINITY_DN1729_c0_g1~~TRINITY_DN1729_c0_g1_i3.p1  ORF type:complete len:102 (-),score=19.59 TRINITY_DN1729_c0_g1_i3:758-1063(-)
MAKSWIHGASLMIQELCYSPLNALVLIREVPKKIKVPCWKPPPVGVLKLNVDGAMFDKLNKAGVEAVLGDEKGNVIMATRKIENGVDGADDIEGLLALRAF